MHIVRALLLVGVTFVAALVGAATIRQHEWLREDRAVRAALLAAARDGHPFAVGTTLRFHSDYYTPEEIARDRYLRTQVTREQLVVALRTGPWHVREPALAERLWEGFTYTHSSVLSRDRTCAILETADGQHFTLCLHDVRTPGAMLVASY